MHMLICSTLIKKKFGYFMLERVTYVVTFFLKKLCDQKKKNLHTYFR